MKIQNLVTHTDRAVKCHFRDIGEPVEFLVTARLQIMISRFTAAPPITAERMALILKEALNREGFEVL
jgi:hypothetical protein